MKRRFSLQLLDLSAVARRDSNDDVAPRARSAVFEGKGELSVRATMPFIVVDTSTIGASLARSLAKNSEPRKMKELLF